MQDSQEVSQTGVYSVHVCGILTLQSSPVECSQCRQIQSDSGGRN